VDGGVKDHSAKDFRFGKRADAYDDGFEGRSSQKFYRLVLREIEVRPGAFVLDVGCGTGALLNRIASVHEINAYGIDMEENMIAVAKNKHPEMDFRLSRCDNMPFEDQTFDVLVACMAYHHFSGKEEFAKEAARVLKPSGVLYIADPRFPETLQKALNAALHRLGIGGEFFNPQEIANAFVPYGFEENGVAFDGHAQIVKLRRSP